MIALISLASRTSNRGIADGQLVRLVGFTLLIVLALTIAHGCHTGGHDLDLEP